MAYSDTPTAEAAAGKRVARRPAVEHGLAMRLAATEYERFGAQLTALTADDWSKQTECPEWDVRAMASHVLGMAEMSASMREQVRQMIAARRRGGLFIDALTGLQVSERREMRPEQVVAEFAKAAPRAARGRRRTPGLMRRRTMPMDQQVGDGAERWTVGFLTEVVLTRDTWIHRVDIARAVGRDLDLTPDHDGVIVADVVREWQGRHGQPCTLTLGGAAGGSWFWGQGGPRYELDAVEFCRVASGRAHGEGLLGTAVPF
ncbi:MAG: maleylpyruvate isomerase family mycothiol-dependent enzyme [Candidatus Dormibacteraeota bacterium]|nr:maleylpyruvate isomerase family mycothiol-dependent enzyme [Candidatus Dormibacteraeota bacterium]